MSVDHPSVLAKRALFQPWMELPDAQWLRTALILRERIDRMIPGEGEVPPLAPDKETELLAGAGLIGNQIVDPGTSLETQETTLRILRNEKTKGRYDDWRRRGDSLLSSLRSDDERNRFRRVHLVKAGNLLGDNLRSLNMGIDCEAKGHYWYTEPAVVALYMEVLALAFEGKVEDTCLVSDNSGYLGLSMLRIDKQQSDEVQGLSDEDQGLFNTLLAKLEFGITGLLSMPLKDFIDWHKDTKGLRAGLREKLANISGNPADGLDAAIGEFRKFRGQLPKPGTGPQPWARPRQWVTSPKALAVLLIALPPTGLAIDWRTAALGTLITAPIGAAAGTISLIRERRGSRWERYLISIRDASSPEPSHTETIEDLIRTELSRH